jgi:hypothetical protein
MSEKKSLKNDANSNLPLIVRHYVKGRFSGAMKVRGKECAVGSSRVARIQLHAGGVAGVCCLLQRQRDGWTVIDLGSQPDVKLNGRVFVEAKVGEKSILEIGVHRLEIIEVPRRRAIFEENLNLVKKGQQLTVVKWHGKVIATSTNEKDLAVFMDSKNVGVEIRKVTVPAVAPMKRKRITLDKEMKRPLGTVAAVLFLFLAIMLGLPMPKEEIKPKDNVYTRMIFDSQILAQKKRQLVSMGVHTPQGTGNGNGSISEGAKGQQSKAVKAVNAIRQAGLQSLIGRIASRASSSARMLAALAATPTANASVDHNELGGFGAMPSGGAATGKSGLLGNGKGFRIGGIGTGGKGGGTGDYKAGTGLGTGATGNGEVGLDDTDTVIEGGLDREVIAAVIREHLGQVRYCYERQLSGNPDLYGKIKVKFSINADGIVASQDIGQSTLKSAMVEECILRRIATWKFPKPKGGTKVLVSYPFLFKSVN